MDDQQSGQRVGLWDRPRLRFLIIAYGVSWLFWVGAWIAALFHLLTHAFFKPLLFLGAGSVIHGMSDDQAIRNMGGLRSKMRRTHWTFLLATLAIAGVVVVAAQANPGWALLAGGLVATVVGCVLLWSFVRRYPAVDAR